MYEACVGNYNEAISAFKRGANRIELCDNLMEDGTTPSVGTIKKTIKHVNIPVIGTTLQISIRVILSYLLVKFMGNYKT